MSWNNTLALTWTKIVPPSRPSISELAIYTKYAHKLREHEKRRLRILILGSTPEFRDWAYEENMQVWIIDANENYHKTINREIRHKTILECDEFKETVIFDKWQNLNFQNFFDIVIGDLAVGNVAPEDLDDLLKRISNALTPNGLYLGKSFFIPKQNVLGANSTLALEKICQQLYSNGEATGCHPYSYLTFFLTMACVDDNNMLDFQKQFTLLCELNKRGFIKNETLKYFENVGWDNHMKFKFYVPTLEHYETLLKKHFTIAQIEYGLDIYSKYFPLHIATKKDCKIYSDK